MRDRILGAIEAGGTKFICGSGTSLDDLEIVEVRTTTPTETLGSVIDFFRRAAGSRLRALGVGSFGPVGLCRDRTTYGCITSTPKVGWQGCPVVDTLERALEVPAGFDTDVNAAALGEARWGAGRGLSDFLYLTVGTGIGGGAIVNGAVLHGLVHTEMGHIPVPRVAGDQFAGSCPYHGDCLEGLASGPAIEARWASRASELHPDHPAWLLETKYLARALATWVCTLSPKRIVMGGGVMKQAHLFPMLRAELEQVLGGYVQAPEIVPPHLGDRAGIAGGFVLAEQAYTSSLAP